jgi:hypothetical protein
MNKKKEKNLTSQCESHCHLRRCNEAVGGGICVVSAREVSEKKKF